MCNAGVLSLKQLYNRIDSSSLIVLDQTILNAIQMSTRHTGRNLIDMYVPSLRDSEHYKSLIRYIFKSNKELIFWASITDPHGILTVDMAKISQAGMSVDTLLNRISGVIWNTSPRYVPDVNSIPSIYAEKWFHEKENPVESRNQILKHCRVEVEIPHCVDENEFVQPGKKWDIDIPGIGYVTRKLAIISIDSVNLTRPDKLLFLHYTGKVNGLLMKTKIIPTSVIYRNNYRMMRYFSSRSRSSFVCGSGLSLFVRKFLEIPAFYTLMLAYPPPNFSDYGFVDGHNYIKCNPEETGIKALEILKDPYLTQSIIERAANLVREKHTVGVRSEHLLNSLSMILNSTLTKAYFRAGEFAYESRTEASSQERV
jgi:hypothetical protein